MITRTKISRDSNENKPMANASGRYDGLSQDVKGALHFPKGLYTKPSKDIRGWVQFYKDDFQSPIFEPTSEVTGLVEGLKEGEVLMYHERTNAFVKLTDSGKISIANGDNNLKQTLLDLVKLVDTLKTEIKTGQDSTNAPVKYVHNFLQTGLAEDKATESINKLLE